MGCAYIDSKAKKLLNYSNVTQSAITARCILPRHKNDAVPCGGSIGFLSDSAILCPSEILQFLAVPGVVGWCDAAG